MISVNDVSFRYGRKREWVLDHLTLHLESNKIYGLLGKNGTGKSTLLYLISGLLRPQRGTVTVDGCETQERRAEMLQDIFLVPEEFDMPHVSLRKYVEINAPFYPNFSEALLHDCLAQFELPQDLHLGRLSMGQKKKVFMSFALATQTRLLLMDEPTNGLDIPSKSQFRRVMANSMTEDRTFVISTHQVRDVDALIDHIVMLDGTRLLLDRSVADVCSRVRFEERTAGEPSEDVLYAMPSLHGTSAICRNPRGEDSPLNLELLFNALLSNPKLLSGCGEAQPERGERREEREECHPAD